MTEEEVRLVEQLILQYAAYLYRTLERYEIELNVNVYDWKDVCYLKIRQHLVDRFNASKSILELRMI